MTLAEITSNVTQSHMALTSPAYAIFTHECISLYTGGKSSFNITLTFQRPGHQQRLLQTFAEDVFIFSLLVHSTLQLSG